MTKRKGVDLMKFIPLGIMAVSLVSGYTLLKAETANSTEKIKAIEIVQTKLSSDSSEIRVSQARTEAQLSLVLDVLKELKKK